MSLKIYAVASSETQSDSDNSIFFNKGSPIERPNTSDHVKLIHDKSISLPISINLLSEAIRNNRVRVGTLLTSEHVDGFYANLCQLWFVTSGATADNIVNSLTKVSSSGKRVLDLFGGPRSYIKRETFVKKYVLKGGPLNIPYVNFENNDSGNVNCVLSYVQRAYPKISKKVVSQFFDKPDTCGNDLIEFCKKYNIYCKLYNIDKTIVYDNKIPHNKSYKDLIAIIANNHFYPHGDSKVIVPEINNVLINDIDKDNNIIIETNKAMYVQDGILENKSKLTRVINDEEFIFEIDSLFFKGMCPNFKYISEDLLKMKSLVYNHPQIESRIKFEIDMNKAFYTVAKEIIKCESQFPIFTASEIYMKFDQPSISDYNYYLISNEALIPLGDYGIITNSLTGFFVNFLINNKLLKITDIEYYKKYSYLTTWSTVLRRIDLLEKNNQHIQKGYIFYNGILGTSYNVQKTRYHNIKPSDINLFNDDQSEKLWELGSDDGELTTVTCEKSKYRSINTCNVYNHIIDQCNLFMLTVLLKIKEQNKDVTLMKIKVDSLCFDKVITIPSEYKSSFKIQTINHEKIHYNTYSPTYYNGNDVIENTMKEITSAFEHNISYHGAPGTGKTHKVKNNHKYDEAMSMTNLCSLNLTTEQVEACTVYSLLGLYSPADINKTLSKYRNKTIWLDEYSMVPLYVWNYLYIMCSVYNVKMIISGDVNQTPPIKEKQINLLTFFFTKIMGKSETLTDDWRNDTAIIKIRDNVLKCETNSQILKNYFLAKQSKDSYIMYDRHLSFTHATKDIVNATILKERGYHYKLIKHTNKLSFVDVSIGCLLVAAISKKQKGVYKNDIWKVVSTDGNYGYKMQSAIRGEYKYFEPNLMQYFTLGFCTTVHSSQGLTITDDVCIHEIQKMIRSDKSILYTAITRSCKRPKLHLYNEPPIGVVDKILYADIENEDDEYDHFDKMTQK